MSDTVFHGPVSGHNVVASLCASGTASITINNDYGGQVGSGRHQGPLRDTSSGTIVGKLQVGGSGVVHIGNSNQNAPTDEEKCLQALFQTDPANVRKEIISAKGKKTEGTCKWVESTKEFQGWKQSPSGLLWIYGSPGKGKTFIAIHLTQVLEAMAGTQPDAVVTYFFCDNMNSKRNTAVSILRGLIYQLLDHEASLISVMLPKWKVQQSDLFCAHSFESLWDIFLLMVESSSAQAVHCVLDALDECDDKSQQMLLVKIRALFDDDENPHQQHRKKLKIAVLSRAYPERLHEALSRFPHINVDDTQAAMEDISLYIKLQADQLSRMKNITDSKLHEKINMTFQERSENSFLWVSFMSQDLKQKSVGELESSLEKLPKGLDAVYERIISMIDTENKDIIQKLLLWVTLASRPLTILELCEALDISETECLTREQVCSDYIKSCAHLLQVREFQFEHRPTIMVTLVHQSAKTFLLGGSGVRTAIVEDQPGHKHMTNRLLSYLSEYYNSIRDREPPNKIFHLLNYATLGWPYHFEQLGDDIQEVMEENNDFFSDGSKLRLRLWGAMNHDAIPLLNLACLYGLFNLAKHAIEKEKKRWQYLLGFRAALNFPWGRKHDTPLHMACSGEFSDILKLLLDAGADLSVKDDMDHTALFYVLRHGKSECCSILMETEQGQKLLTECQEEYLHSAVWGGSEEVCQILIEKYNLSLSLEDQHGNTPLSTAIKSSHLDLARKLVSKWHASTANHHKLLFNCLDCWSNVSQTRQALNLVINEWGVDINGIHDDGCSHLCSLFSQKQVLESTELFKVLLSYNADWGFRHTQGDTILHCALRKIHAVNITYDVLKELVKPGRLDINALNARGQTPLHIFTPQLDKYSRYHPGGARPIFEVCKDLLDLGARRDIKDTDGSTALDFANESLERGGEHLQPRFIAEIEEVIGALESYATVPMLSITEI